MATKQNERTLRMKEAYCYLHFVEGLSPTQIGKRFSLSMKTVYNSLQEIADENGVPRSSLLDHPGAGNFAPHVMNFAAVKPFNQEEFDQKSQAMIGTLDDLQAEVKNTYDKLETADPI